MCVSTCDDASTCRPDSVEPRYLQVHMRARVAHWKWVPSRGGWRGDRAYVVRSLLSEGHSRSSFTLDVYAHVLPGMGEQVASVIETALGGTADG